MKTRSIRMDDKTWKQAKAQAKEKGYSGAGALLRYLVVNKAIEKI